MSCNSFYLKPRSVKIVEYLKLLFISLGSPLVALEREIFELARCCLMSEKIGPNSVCYNLPPSKYMERDITLERASCNTDFFQYYSPKVAGI